MMRTVPRLIVKQRKHPVRLLQHSSQSKLAHSVPSQPRLVQFQTEPSHEHSLHFFQPRRHPLRKPSHRHVHRASSGTAPPLPIVTLEAAPVSTPPVPQPSLAQFQYRGRDLHAYTRYLVDRLPEYIRDLREHNPDTVPLELWTLTLQTV